MAATATYTYIHAGTASSGLTGETQAAQRLECAVADPDAEAMCEGDLVRSRSGKGKGMADGSHETSVGGQWRKRSQETEEKEEANELDRIGRMKGGVNRLIL